MIKKTTRRISAGDPSTMRPSRSVVASSSITSTARRQGVRPASVSSRITANVNLTPEKKIFCNQLRQNVRRNTRITAATNTSNIMARPDFLELLPLFIQQLLVLDVFGSVSMKSRQQLIPYFKFIAENTKGETKAGDVLSSPFVNRQGSDPNFTGRLVKNEVIGEGATGWSSDAMFVAYTPVLPGSVTVVATTTTEGATSYTDDGAGNLINPKDGSAAAYINYSNGAVQFIQTIAPADGVSVKATYQYDNETVGPDETGNYGAKMAKGYLQLDEFNMVAEAHEIACYWSIYSAFAAQQEYGSNIGDIAKEASFSELTAEINSYCFAELAKAAKINPTFNWNAAPVLNGSVVPSDYLNMLKLKLNQAAAAIYQRTRLARPNRIVCGTTAGEYISMINGFRAASVADSVGPYHKGTLDEFEIYVDPNYNPDTWVMACKSNDIRRNSGLFGEYMPIVSTDAIGLANSSVQQGYASMYSVKIVNPDTVVSGKLLGTF